MDFKIDGLEGFDKAIKRLDKRAARNALRRAVAQSTQPVVKEARRLADAKFDSPSKRSKMGIKRRNLKKQERTALGVDMATIVYFAPDGYKLRFWEQGFTRYGRHYPARPMLRPALDSQEATVIKTFNKKAKTIIEKEAAKRKR